MSDELKYAVLIDAENIASKYIKIIMDEISNHGVVTYRRIYGDWTSTVNRPWKEVLLDNSITPIQQYSYTMGKNASDSAMIIDAMDILYSGSVDGFCLVSSDSDFTRLAARLRESGMNVIGMGESKTPTPFIAACNQFKYLDILYANEVEESDREKNEETPEKMRSGARRYGNGSRDNKNKTKRDQLQPQTKAATLRKALKSIVAEGSGEDGWISSSDVGNQLAKRFPDFDVRNYGYKKLTLFIESLGDFDVDRIADDPTSKTQKVFVRIKE